MRKALDAIFTMNAPQSQDALSSGSSDNNKNNNDDKIPDDGDKILNPSPIVENISDEEQSIPKFQDNVDPVDLDKAAIDAKASEAKKAKLNIWVKTVNDLTRRHEAVAFLNDSKISTEDKREALTTRNSNGVTALFWAIRRRAKFSLIEKMVEIGGRDMVLLCNNLKENVLHNAAFCGSSFEVFETIVEAGGRQTILQLQDRLGHTTLHYACAWKLPYKTIKYLADA